MSLNNNATTIIIIKFFNFLLVTVILFVWLFPSPVTPTQQQCRNKGGEWYERTVEGHQHQVCVRGADTCRSQHTLCPLYITLHPGGGSAGSWTPYFPDVDSSGGGPWVTAAPGVKDAPDWEDAPNPELTVNITLDITLKEFNIDMRRIFAAGLEQGVEGLRRGVCPLTSVFAGMGFIERSIVCDTNGGWQNDDPYFHVIAVQMQGEQKRIQEHLEEFAIANQCKNPEGFWHDDTHSNQQNLRFGACPKGDVTGYTVPSSSNASSMAHKALSFFEERSKEQISHHNLAMTWNVSYIIVSVHVLLIIINTL